MAVTFDLVRAMCELTQFINVSPGTDDFVM